MTPTSWLYEAIQQHNDAVFRSYDDEGDQEPEGDPESYEPSGFTRDGTPETD